MEVLMDSQPEILSQDLCLDLCLKRLEKLVLGQMRLKRSGRLAGVSPLTHSRRPNPASVIPAVIQLSFPQNMRSAEEAPYAPLQTCFNWLLTLQVITINHKTIKQIFTWNKININWK